MKPPTIAPYVSMKCHPMQIMHLSDCFSWLGRKLLYVLELSHTWFNKCRALYGTFVDLRVWIVQALAHLRLLGLPTYWLWRAQIIYFCHLLKILNTIDVFVLHFRLDWIDSSWYFWSSYFWWWSKPPPEYVKWDFLMF